MSLRRPFDYGKSKVLIDQLEVFRDIPAVEIEQYLAGSSTALISAGKIVFNEGELGDHAIFVTRGLVMLVKGLPSKRYVTVELIGSGEPLGVMAVIDNRPFPLEAKTYIETGLLYIPKANFESLAKKYPKVINNLHNVLRGRFVRAQNRIAHLVSAGARSRVLNGLGMLLERPEVLRENDTVLTTRKQLAQLAGITTETCIRMTNALQDDNIISFPGRKSIRIDRARLNAELTATESTAADAETLLP